MTETKIIIGKEEWRLLFKGDECMIVDSEGRCRYTGKDHTMTAAHLAMELARHPFQSIANLDESLRMFADQFIGD
jgi:hypothetical protein